jgi:hypothetical protein
MRRPFTGSTYRPITDELNRLFRCFDDNEHLMPMARIVKVAGARARRRYDTCRVARTDLAPALLDAQADDKDVPIREGAHA